MKKFLLAATMSGAGAALGHHSTAVDNMDKTVTIDGTVRVFQWSNPHVWLWVNVPEHNGAQAQVWGVESAAPVQLSRKGIKWNSFKAGDVVEVTIHPLRSGQNGGLFLRAKFADGHVISAGDPAAQAVPPGVATP